MDKLEKFILDNKRDFDESRASEKGWKELDEKMTPQRENWSILWKVAAVLFFATTVALVFSDVPSESPVQITESSEDSIEEFFVQLIDYKREEYLALANEADSEELFDDLVELDSAYVSLKMSYEQLESEELLEAMLENLQLRMYILNEQIEMLKNGGTSDEEVYHSS